MDRDEWEFPLPGPELDFGLLPAAARKVLGRITPDDLKPVVEVETERHIMIIRRASPLGPELVVEADADRASVRAGDGAEHFCECELELMEGDVTGFFTLAAEIHARCPLPMSATTKATRGFRLLSGDTVGRRPIGKFELRADQSLHDALNDIFAACIRNVVANEESCIAGTDPEGVHQMRVSVRRLRSALKIFSPYFRPTNVGWMAEDLRWLGGQLGPARDWDVFIGETLASMAGRGIDQGIDAEAIGALRRRAGQARERAYTVVRETLGSERYANLTFRLTGFIALDGWLAGPLDDHDPLLQHLETIAGGALDRPYRKLTNAGHGLADQSFEQRHALRIRLKKLRYAVEFLRRVYPEKRTRPFIEALRALQDRFGRINDLAQAERLTEQLTRRSGDGAEDKLVHLAAGRVRGWHAHALHEIEPKLLADWDRFILARPFWSDKR